MKGILLIRGYFSHLLAYKLKLSKMKIKRMEIIGMLNVNLLEINGIDERRGLAQSNIQVMPQRSCVVLMVCILLG